MARTTAGRTALRLFLGLAVALVIGLPEKVVVLLDVEAVVELERALVGLAGLVELPFLLERDGQVVEGGRVVRVQQDGLLEPEARLLERQLTEPQSCALHEHFAARKVEIHYNQDVRDIPTSFDGVIVSAGFAPRVAVAQQAGLATHRGIQVNEYLCTDDPGIYAVGDVAEIGTRLYPFVSPIRSQALWLAEHLEGRAKGGWTSPAFTPVIKIHDFKLPEKANTASDAK